MFYTLVIHAGLHCHTQQRPNKHVFLLHTLTRLFEISASHACMACTRLSGLSWFSHTAVFSLNLCLKSGVLEVNLACRMSKKFSGCSTSSVQLLGKLYGRQLLEAFEAQATWISADQATVNISLQYATDITAVHTVICKVACTS